VVQPYLEVIGRCFDDDGRLKSLHLHARDRCSGKIVDETQAVEAGGPNIDVGTLAILVTQPLDRFLDLESALPFPENHLTAIAAYTEIKTLATHRA
jgi:hypothetical protein